MINSITEDWILNHLYFGPDFSKWLSTKKLERIKDLEHLTVMELLGADGITLPRIRRIIQFMQKHHLIMKLYPDLIVDDGDNKE